MRGPGGHRPLRRSHQRLLALHSRGRLHLGRRLDKARLKDPEYALFKEQILDPIEYPDPVRTLSLRLDGKPAAGLGGFFFRSAVFTARLPDDNIFDALGFCLLEDIPPS